MYTPKDMLIDMFTKQYKALSRRPDFKQIVERYADEIYNKIKEMEKELTG